MPKHTIQDVARLAGVGVGTVSRVLNNHPSVKDSTRARILQAIAELDYTPNPHARRIAGGRSYTVSVMLPMIASEFYIRLLSSLEESLDEKRYDTAIFPLMGHSRLERYLNSHTMPYQADGIIMATHDLSGMFPEGHLPTKQPVVLVDGHSHIYDCTFVDNKRGGYLAAEYVAKFNYPIYTISLQDDTDPLLMSPVFTERMQGFQEGLDAAGRQVEQDYPCLLHYQGGLEGAQQLLRHAKFPCIVFAAADLLARPLLEEAKHRKLRIGQDILIVGYDNQPWAAELGLTTLHQPVEEMGRIGAHLLLERLNGYDGPPRIIRFDPLLIERASTLSGSKAIQ